MCHIIFLKSSGIKLDERCKNMFSLVKDKHEHAWVIMKIENKQAVVVKATHGKLESRTDVGKNRILFDEMLQKVEEMGGPCYILFDFIYEQSSGSSKDKPIYIYWCDDDTVGVKEKMMYAATNNELKKQCDGFAPYEMHDKDDFNFKFVSDDLKGKDRQ